VTNSDDGRYRNTAILPEPIQELDLSPKFDKAPFLEGWVRGVIAALSNYN